MTRRNGITLMEVLVAIFVLLIGLAGVFSLIPIAKSYMADGSKYDAVAVLGQKAMHDLEIRKDLLDPSNWFAPAESTTGGSCSFLEVCPATTIYNGVKYDSSYNYNFFLISPIQTIPAAPFVLDPMGCAHPSSLSQNGNGGTVGPGGATNVPGAYSASFFPPSGFSLDGVGNPGSPAPMRVTVPRNGGVFMDGNGNRFARPMAFAQASRIFQSSDDLLFERPKDETLRPVLPTPPLATSQGDYSWFAVIDNVQRPWNPGPDGAWGVAGVNDNAPDPLTDEPAEAGWALSDDIALWQTSGGEQWHIWVVVVHKRDLQLVPATTAEIPPERMCYCDFLSAPLPVAAGSVLSNAGIGGGDCLLSISSTQAASPDWLNVKVNQWIMLSSWPNLAAPPAGVAAPVRGQLPIVQWFRIAAVGETVAIPGAAGWQRNVTLAGPDWNPYKFVDAIGVPPTTGFSGVNFQTAYATIVDGAVGMVEGTIEQGQN